MNLFRNFLSANETLIKMLLKHLVTLLLCAVGAAVQAADYAGPLGSNPDPHVTYYGGFYYYTGTARPEEGSIVMLHRAKTLQEIKYSPTQTVWSEQQSVAVGGPCCYYWAPELHRIDNKWYIYFSAVQRAGQEEIKWHRNYVIENTNSDPFVGTWTYKGQLKDSQNDFWAIDATILQLRGTNYILYSGHADNDHSLQRIYISKLENPWTQVPGRTMITEPQYSFETNGNVNEGPEILMKNGKVFMVYSANGCWTNQYNLGMLWMNEGDDPMNAASWRKLNYPVFGANPAVGAYSPGHNSFFKSPDGTQDWIAYHAAATANEGCEINRFFNAKLVNWKSDGFPDFGAPVANGHLLPGPSGEPGLSTGAVLANGVYEVVNVVSGRSLDVPSCRGESGLKLQQWDVYHNDCQKFVFHNVGEDYYSISAVGGGMLLTIKDCKNDPATDVWLYKPTGQDCQKWRIVSHGNNEYSFISKSANMAFDLRSGNQANGADYIVWTTTFEWPQKFRLTRV
ncbi:hypothetical protein Poli38472_000005 [Pythium oligandrum]|uniref:Ricin B lectin domain-containing protein n=1 Tax=Pythium oligandrum TaxID=41045 RepID=A0A8K1CC62_PYTOL|nr:hypothetical protein Poli38472_000005 [Pythium oligandrum]|eukprot:TMW59963.1 hypothetical protein Poli38472_000005 [Pythium oligandrum]